MECHKLYGFKHYGKEIYVFFFHDYHENLIGKKLTVEHKKSSIY